MWRHLLYLSWKLSFLCLCIIVSCFLFRVTSSSLLPSSFPPSLYGRKLFTSSKTGYNLIWAFISRESYIPIPFSTFNISKLCMQNFPKDAFSKYSSYIDLNLFLLIIIFLFLVVISFYPVIQCYKGNTVIHPPNCIYFLLVFCWIVYPTDRISFACFFL